jgi:tRNA pseudouridine38-40 synthase
MEILEDTQLKAYLIKFSYFGTDFEGFSLSNSQRSVEAVIQHCLLQNNISTALKTSSRTDKFVSAISNCMYIESKFRISKILGILNAEIPEMVFHSWAEVERGFNPRHTSKKSYVYLIKINIEKREAIKKILLKFEGTHDFRNFCKVDTRNTIRTIDRIEFTETNEFLIATITAKSFIWQQIRFIVGYANDQCGLNEEDPFSDNISRPVPALPHFLFLKDIYFDGITFNTRFPRHKKKINYRMDLSYFSYYFFKELQNGYKDAN